MQRVCWGIVLLVAVGCGQTQQPGRPQAPVVATESSDSDRPQAKAVPPASFVTTKITPLFQTIDLDIGEQVTVTLPQVGKEQNRVIATIKLLKVVEIFGSVRGAIRGAEVELEINGKKTKLKVGNFHRPRTFQRLRIDCTVTSGYNKVADPAIWGLDKRARFRVWRWDSLLARRRFTRPVFHGHPRHAQRWGENQPIDGGPRIIRGFAEYEPGICFGTAPGRTIVRSMSNGQVVAVNGQVWPDVKKELTGANRPFHPRAGSVTILDNRGWFITYENFTRLDPQVKLGGRVKPSEVLGLAGAEGRIPDVATWRLEIRAKQPSGKWGTVPAFAILDESYLSRYPRDVVAWAGVTQLVHTNERVRLTARGSFSERALVNKVDWLHDGKVMSGKTIDVIHKKPGTYCYVVRVRDEKGRRDYGIVHVMVVKPGQQTYPPRFHVAVNPPQPFKDEAVVIAVRKLGGVRGLTAIDFNDGPPPTLIRHQSTLNGYVFVTHKYRIRGIYFIKVNHQDKDVPVQTAIPVFVHRRYR